MLYIEEAKMTKSAGEESFSVDSAALKECEDIMEAVRAEAPHHWPYGLTVGDHTRANGSVFLIRDASTKKAIGFTGWQEFKQGSRRVGYYSIGILPEYRGNGFAKAAVAQLLHQKAAGVDQVKAYIVRSNKPSIALAKSLGVPIEH